MLARVCVTVVLIAASGLPVLVAEDPVSRETRRPGISTTEAGDNDYGAAFEVAQRAGIQATSLSLAWDDIEVSPGVFQNDPLRLSGSGELVVPGTISRVTRYGRAFEDHSPRLGSSAQRERFVTCECVGHRSSSRR